MAIFRHLPTVLLLTLLNITQSLGAMDATHEAVMIVQAVSKNQRSFVLTKGAKDGTFRGQEFFFANENVSILCKAQEVNRDYSLWVPVDTNVNIPFKKDDFISYSSHHYRNLITEIDEDVDENNPSSSLLVKPPEIIANNNFQDPSVKNEKKTKTKTKKDDNLKDQNISFFQNNNADKKYRGRKSISLKGSFNRGLSQSSSAVSADKNSSHSGYTFSSEFHYRFTRTFEMSLGGRLDNEVYRLTNPELDIPTSRMIATLAATYYFLNFTSNEYNLYVTLAGGIGQSKTTTNEIVSAGSVIVLPEVRLGYLLPVSKNMSMIFEGSIESLSTTETFTDDTKQVTNATNFKLAIGLKF